MIKGKCPYHGSKYMITENNAAYCGYPTPGQRFSKCFYHPAYKTRKRILAQENNVKPDVMQAIRKSLTRYRKMAKQERTTNSSTWNRNKSGLQKMNNRMALMIEEKKKENK